jgi:hypothetical protein
MSCSVFFVISFCWEVGLVALSFLCREHLHRQTMIGLYPKGAANAGTSFGVMIDQGDIHSPALFSPRGRLIERLEV